MKKQNVLKIGIMICLFLVMGIISFSAQAQSPAANINGPLKAIAGSANITITSQVALAATNPTLKYTFQNNTSGAFIVSKGTYTYDPVKEIGTHTVVVNPGNSSGGFTINLEVETPAGIGKCSKSVIVTNSSFGGALNDN